MAETAYTITKTITTTKIPQQTLGKGENLISRVTTLLDLNVQCSTRTSQDIQRSRKVWPIRRGKQSTKTEKRKILMADKDFKTAVLKMLKEL